MRIGIDMRMAGSGFGIGTYIDQLVKALLARKSPISYRLFFDSQFSRKEFENFSKIHGDCRLLKVKYYSLAEQLKLPFLLARENLDLMHFPNFNVPILYPGKSVVTIHDLIHHKFPGKKKKNFYYRWAYRAIIQAGARKALKVIAVSSQTKKDIQQYLKIPEYKVSVIYEGVPDIFSQTLESPRAKAVLDKYGIKQPYILSVGVWRKYKNLPMLSRVFSRLKRRGIAHQLVLAGAPDMNYPEIKEKILAAADASSLIATGKVPDQELLALYRQAEVYVSPSLSEGFGLTSLEAQACGLPVASSDIKVAREILADSVEYFNPNDETEFTAVLGNLLANAGKRAELAEKSLTNSKRFSWAKTAELTEKLYLSVLKS